MSLASSWTVALVLGAGTCLSNAQGVTALLTRSFVNASNVRQVVVENYNFPTPPLSGQALTIELPFIPAATSIDDEPLDYVLQVQLFTTQSNFDLGHVHLVGNARYNVPVQVLIAAPGVDWPNDFELTIEPSFRHWAGITCSSRDTSLPFNALEGRVELAAAVLGNIQGSATDSVAVGRVFRIQAINENNISGRGKILLPITVTPAPTILDFRPNVIDVITAADQLGGAIICDRIAAEETSYVYSIGSLIVGPNINATGITAPIRARGNINIIISSGPITIPTINGQPGIQADGAIRSIYVGDENETGFPTIAKDINAKITAGIPETAVIGSAPMRTLRTAGDLLEDIEVEAIRAADTAPGYGIWVGGTVYGTITIRS